MTARQRKVLSKRRGKAGGQIQLRKPHWPAGRRAPARAASGYVVTELIALADTPPAGRGDPAAAPRHLALAVPYDAELRRLLTTTADRPQDVLPHGGRQLIRAYVPRNLNRPVRVGTRIRLRSYPYRPKPDAPDVRFRVAGVIEDPAGPAAR